MLYDNVVTEFYSKPSDSSKPTSKYFVCENGTIRAKVAAAMVYARAYNICYVDQTARNNFGSGYKGVSAVYSSSKKEVTMVWAKENDSSDKVTVVGKLSPDSTHNRVYEFACDDNGKITNRHMGSKITSSYDGKNSGISENKVNQVCATLMNSDKDEITSFQDKSLS